MRLLTAALCCLLTSCGLCGDTSHTIHVYFADDLGGSAGRTEWDCWGDTRIYILPTLSHPYDVMVLMHELLHALGEEDHYPGGCALSSPVLSLVLCEQDIALIHSRGGIFYVHSHHPWLDEPLWLAIHLLNSQAGVERFRLVP